ncbi:hypothetical protein BIY27_26065 [Gibbsiella quercinecans]|nr:hypothetical protein BIY27_26065 [Gibbsiella quercinecans]
MYDVAILPEKHNEIKGAIVTICFMPAYVPKMNGISGLEEITQHWLNFPLYILIAPLTGTLWMLSHHQPGFMAIPVRIQMLGGKAADNSYF